jgi:hypothetical protein
LNVHAATPPIAEQVHLEIAPISPIVITSDLIDHKNRVRAPWIELHFRVVNTSREDITLRQIDVDVASRSSMQHYKFMFPPRTIRFGESVDLGHLYADHLPPTRVPNYAGDVTASGWVGTFDRAKSPLKIQTSFRTQ